MEHKDGNRVADDVRDRPGQHTAHRKIRAAVGADDRIGSLPENIDWDARRDPREIVPRIGQIRLRRTEQRKQRIAENIVEYHHHDPHQHAERHRIADSAVCVLRVLLAKADGNEAACAVADHHGEAERQHRQWEDDARRAVAEIADAPANEDLVDDVVKRPDQQRDRTRHGKFPHQLSQRGRPQKVLFFFHNYLHKRKK